MCDDGNKAKLKVLRQTQLPVTSLHINNTCISQAFHCFQYLHTGSNQIPEAAKKVISCPSIHAPSREHLVVWFHVTNTFLVWNVRWSQSASHMSSTCKIATLILFWGCQFLCGRTLHISTLFFKVWATTNLLTNKLKRFVWGMLLAVLA